MVFHLFHYEHGKPFHNETSEFQPFRISRKKRDLTILLHQAACWHMACFLFMCETTPLDNLKSKEVNCM